MRIRVLGSAAGGGVPQWNCGCANCALARAGGGEVAPRTQDSMAIAGRGRGWLLVNASPDVLRQIERFDGLWPPSRRGTGIAAIVLTNGDLDHVAGLLSLRESQPLRILSTARVRSGLVEHNALLRTLARTPDQVTWIELAPGREEVLDDVGLGVTAVPVPGGSSRFTSRAWSRRLPRTMWPSACARSRPRRAPPWWRPRWAISRACRPSSRAPTPSSSTVRSSPPTSSSPKASARRSRATWRTSRSAGRRGAWRGWRAWRRRAESSRTSTTRTPCSAKGRRSAAAVAAAGWETAFDGMEVSL